MFIYRTQTYTLIPSQYPDGQADDDKYAAACEMYLSAYALGDANVQTYRNAMTSSSHFTKMSQWDWATVTGAGTLSLYAVKDNGLTESEMISIKTNIKSFADSIASAIESEGYPSNLSYQNGFSQYPWGSNSFIMNRMIALAYAHEMTGDNSYQDYLLRSMDYIMGSNAMDISYVTGYGAKAVSRELSLLFLVHQLYVHKLTLIGFTGDGYS